MYLIKERAKNGGYAIFIRTVTTQRWTQVDWVKDDADYTAWLRTNELEERNPDIDALATLLDDADPEYNWGRNAAETSPNFRLPMKG